MEASHNTESSRVSGEETFVSLRHECKSARRSRHYRKAAFTTTSPPPSQWQRTRIHQDIERIVHLYGKAIKIEGYVLQYVFFYIKIGALLKKIFF